MIGNSLSSDVECFPCRPLILSVNVPVSDTAFNAFRTRFSSMFRVFKKNCAQTGTSSPLIVKVYFLVNILFRSCLSFLTPASPSPSLLPCAYFFSLEPFELFISLAFGTCLTCFNKNPLCRVADPKLQKFLLIINLSLSVMLLHFCLHVSRHLSFTGLSRPYCFSTPLFFFHTYFFSAFFFIFTCHFPSFLLRFLPINGVAYVASVPSLEKGFLIILLISTSFHITAAPAQ